MSDDEMEDGWGCVPDDQICQDFFFEEEDINPIEQSSSPENLWASKSSGGLGATLDPLDKIAPAPWYQSTLLSEYAQASEAEMKGTLHLFLEARRKMKVERAFEQNPRRRSRAPSPDILLHAREKRHCASTESSQPQPPPHAGARRLRSNSESFLPQKESPIIPAMPCGDSIDVGIDDDGDGALHKCQKRMERLDKLAETIDVSRHHRQFSQPSKRPLS